MSVVIDRKAHSNNQKSRAAEIGKAGRKMLRLPARSMRTQRTGTQFDYTIFTSFMSSVTCVYSK